MDKKTFIAEAREAFVKLKAGHIRTDGRRALLMFVVDETTRQGLVQVAGPKDLRDKLVRRYNSDFAKGGPQLSAATEAEVNALIEELGLELIMTSRRDKIDMY